MTPGWILDILAALMLAVATVSAARLAVPGPAGSRLVLAWPGRPCQPRTRSQPGTFSQPGTHSQAGTFSRQGAGADIGHLLMAIAMAGALASSLATLPNAVWAAVFGVLTGWFAYQAVDAVRADGIHGLGGGQCAPSLVHAAAMLYMSLTVAGRTATSAVAGGGAMATMGTSQPLAYPTVAFALALILVGYAIWDLDQLSARRYRVAPAAADASAGTLASGSTAAAPAHALPLQAVALRATLVSPAMTVACRAVMGVTMAFMLVITL